MRLLPLACAALLALGSAFGGIASAKPPQNAEERGAAIKALTWHDGEALTLPVSHGTLKAPPPLRQLVGADAANAYEILNGVDAPRRRSLRPRSEPRSGGAREPSRPAMKRGDVYWALLEPRSGAERRGRRPVIVVSHDGFNDAGAWRSIIVVPVSTSRQQAARGRTVVALPRGSAGLPSESVAVCHQVTTVDRSKLARRLGSLTRVAMDDVGIALRVAMDLL